MKLYVENRDLVPIEQIPKYVQQAFVAVEDSRFMSIKELITRLYFVLFIKTR